ncbi:MAG: V-type ATP synthase subunit B [Synergistaceae bacterium]|jgi:V/A-type H+-transporting ATPase subunit B|nr:V-type ATP synthase subunit B [Synergistaceae bacterium]
MSMKLFREGTRGIREISGSLLFVENVREGGYGELVSIETDSGPRMGQILQAGDDLCVVRVFDGTEGLETGRTTVWLERDVMKVGVGEGLRGQVLNGRGQPLNGGRLFGLEALLPIGGLPIDPARRRVPDVALETGISSLDLMNTLVLGQNLPIFAPPGLPADRLATWIARRTTVFDRTRQAERSRFLLVFAALGVTNREADRFMSAFYEDDAVQNGIFLLNTAGDSAAERLLTPRIALTIAEYFAFVRGDDVMVIMTDMLRYCDALREIGAEETSGRRGPMHADLAEIYERSGCVRGGTGSVTLLPVITVPNDDMTRLSGCIGEGQIVLDRRLHEMGIFPPVDVLSSQSRLMNGAIGRGRTFESHGALADQLYAACAKVGELRRLRRTVGDDALSDEEKRCLSFGERFEKSFLAQNETRRSFAESEKAAREALSALSPD